MYPPPSSLFLSPSPLSLPLLPLPPSLSLSPLSSLSSSPLNHTACT